MTVHNWFRTCESPHILIGGDFISERGNGHRRWRWWWGRAIWTLHCSLNFSIWRSPTGVLSSNNSLTLTLFEGWGWHPNVIKTYLKIKINNNSKKNRTIIDDNQAICLTERLHAIGKLEFLFKQTSDRFIRSLIYDRNDRQSNCDTCTSNSCEDFNFKIFNIISKQGASCNIKSNMSYHLPDVQQWWRVIIFLAKIYVHRVGLVFTCVYMYIYRAVYILFGYISSVYTLELWEEMDGTWSKRAVWEVPLINYV